MTSIRAVIFDCDGVLVDSEPTGTRELARMLTEIGVPMTPEDVARDFTGRAWTSVIEVVEARLGAPPPPDLTETYRARRDAALADVQAIEGIAETLDRIDLPYCVASSGDHGKMAVTLGATGLRERFEGRIFSATDVPGGRGKPAPDLFLHAAREMGFEPATTAVIEDSRPGVEAALAAGMHPFAYRLRAEGATCFDDMRELPELLGACDARS